MLSFSRTTDAETIRAIVTHPRLYDHLTDDGSPYPDQFEVIESPAIWYVLVRDGQELLGLFLLVPQSSVCFEIHTALLPCAWGERAAEASLGITQWMFERTPARRIVTSVPSYNRLALRFALKAGLIEYGLNPRSYLKRGKLYDQILLGISK